MCTNVNHDYGVSTSTVAPLLAVPLAGIVKITVKDLRDTVIGKTTSNSKGEWTDTFCLDDGTYVITFDGHFRPIGEGFTSTYSRPVKSVSVTIVVPLGSTPDTEAPPENLGPIGPTGPTGSLGDPGEIGDAGETGPEGAMGPQGGKGDIGPEGLQGPLGPSGLQGEKGKTGPQGSAGPQGLQGPKGSLGLTGAKGSTGTSNRVRYMFIENPTDTDSFPIGFEEKAITIDTIYSETDIGTVTFIIEQRDRGSANVAGTSILVDAAIADADGDIRTSTDFLYPDIPIESWLQFVASAVSGSPTGVWVAVSYTVIS